MKKLIGFLITSALVVTLMAAYSLPPNVPVTRQDLALNTRGEIIVESKRDIPGRDFPVYVKRMATSEEGHINEYIR
jgi:hypothetical protein